MHVNRYAAGVIYIKFIPLDATTVIKVGRMVVYCINKEMHACAVYGVFGIKI